MYHRCSSGDYREVQFAVVEGTVSATIYAQTSEGYFVHLQRMGHEVEGHIIDWHNSRKSICLDYFIAWWAGTRHNRPFS